MQVPRLTINLDDPPSTRWLPLVVHRDAMRELLSVYTVDIGGVEVFGELLEDYLDGHVGDSLIEDLRIIGELSGLSLQEGALCNLYYDALKFLIGCTGFAVEDSDGPLHARNLDWHSPNDVLSRHTLVVDWARGDQIRYTTVGWPGFISVLSGVAPGRFAVTLNAVLSDEAPLAARPMTLLIREVLDCAPDFATAVDVLSHTPVASDSLLLVTGTRPGERVVLERTPRSVHQRWGRVGEPLVVTNDFRMRCDSTDTGVGVLAETSCARYDRAMKLLESSPASTPAECLKVLSDGGVRMGITVQQMVFRALTGTVDVAT